MKSLDKSPDATRLQVSKSLAETIAQCLSDLNSLTSRLDPGRGWEMMNRVGLRALKWPFKSKDVVKVIEALNVYSTSVPASIREAQSLRNAAHFGSTMSVPVALRRRRQKISDHSLARQNWSLALLNH
jgi:hypothetical protein